MPSIDPSVLSRLAEIRRTYVQNLDTLVAELHQLITQADGGACRPPIVKAAALAHKIHGTSGTMGLTGVSDAARSLELALLEARDSPTPGARWPVVSEALDEFREAVGVAKEMG